MIFIYFFNMFECEITQLLLANNHPQENTSWPYARRVEGVGNDQKKIKKKVDKI